MMQKSDPPAPFRTITLQLHHLCWRLYGMHLEQAAARKNAMEKIQNFSSNSLIFLIESWNLMWLLSEELQWVVIDSLVKSLQGVLLKGFLSFDVL